MGRKLCIKMVLYFSVRHGQYVKVLQEIVERLVKVQMLCASCELVLGIFKPV